MAHLNISTQLLDGRRVGRIINNICLDTDATVQEALDYGHVVGKKESITANAVGILKAMIDGVGKDGNGRKIDGYISINAYPQGRLEDITDEFDKTRMKVVARARMLKKFFVDTRGWTFTIEGSTGSFSIESISTGEEMNVIFGNEDVLINGKGLVLGEGDKVRWELPDGTAEDIFSDYLSSSANRITADKTAFSDLVAHAQDGDIVKFTITIGGKKAVKTAVYRISE